MRQPSSYNPMVMLSGYEMSGSDLQDFLEQFYPDHEFHDVPLQLLSTYRFWRNHLRDHEYQRAPEIIPKDWPRLEFLRSKIPYVTVFFPLRAPVAIIEGEDQLSDPLLCTPDERDQLSLQKFADLVASRGKQLDTTKLRFTCVKHIDPKRHPDADLYYGTREAAYPNGLSKKTLKEIYGDEEED
ncbi:hypothetical protein CYLTODRAFT_491036 [Cylindrobasidium torrendii FP15055 ss-10]|uniref:Uncharacterized protein n=1 Tax=Cylindrobasidium torrendii FP15055 ss-10 TaxID=1314674 RepID=A0A0D7B8Q7_9AGAR|nr:hypothetical protein CYLTODRAFT_491036 [Cylindrobasidium torrendii FP15055 ss-10]